MNSETSGFEESEVMQYWRGLTRINGVTRAIINSSGKSIVVKRIDFVTKKVYSADSIWYSYDQNLGYYIIE